MSPLATSSPGERFQALQQLKPAFGQPDGSMVFTFEGNVYRTLSTNSDSTLRVINTRTGQITSSLDPVDVYDSALMASGEDPILAPPPEEPAPPQPNIMDQIAPKAGMVMTVTQLLTMWSGALKGVATTFTMSGISAVAAHSGWLTAGRAGMQALFRNPIFQGTLGMAGAVFNGYSLYRQATAFWEKPSAMGALGLGASAFGVAMGVNSLLIATHAITTATATATAAATATSSGAFATALAAAIPIWGWLVAGGIILSPLIIKGLKALFGWGPTPEAKAIRNLNKALTPVVWSAGPVIFVAAGTAALLMGWPKGIQAPIMASLTVPQSYTTRAMGGAIPRATDPKTPTVLVEHGNGKEPGRVVIVSPSGIDSEGNSILRLNTFTLSKNFEFVSSEKTPQQSYIPFFIYRNGKAEYNPQVARALEHQDSLLRSILSGGLDATEAMSAMQLAAATNKYGVSPGAAN